MRLSLNELVTKKASMKEAFLVENMAQIILRTS
jgi:hypothetical protein